MPIACCRFTTSKLKAYEDLRKIKTYGFRGEALASISIISTVTITTRKAEDKCAYKAVYKGIHLLINCCTILDGQMVGEISQSAGLPGTIICAEKLFHNMPSRLASFKQPHEEANRIADCMTPLMNILNGHNHCFHSIPVLIRYAIHYPNVAFAYHRLDGKGYDFRTSGNGVRNARSFLKALLFEGSTCHNPCFTTRESNKGREGRGLYVYSSHSGVYQLGIPWSSASLFYKGMHVHTSGCLHFSSSTGSTCKYSCYQSVIFLINLQDKLKVFHLWVCNLLCEWQPSYCIIL